MEENILNKLQAERDFLSGVDARLADVILENPKKFISYSMAELSEISEVSQGSIVNFSRKINNSGFADLKMKIAQGLQSYNPKKFNNALDSDGVKDVMKKSLEDMSFYFEETIKINSEETLKNAAELILKAKKIQIYGLFQSGLVAKDFYYQLLKLGLPAIYTDDPFTCRVLATTLDKECLTIAVSSTGKTKELLNVIKIAKEKNCPVLVITRNPKSPIALLGDELITIAAGGKSVSSIDEEIRLTELFIIDCLCSYIRNKTKEHGEEQFFKLKDILSLHNIED